MPGLAAAQSWVGAPPYPSGQLVHRGHSRPASPCGRGALPLRSSSAVGFIQVRVCEAPAASPPRPQREKEVGGSCRPAEGHVAHAGFCPPASGPPALRHPRAVARHAQPQHPQVPHQRWVGLLESRGPGASTRAVSFGRDVGDFLDRRGGHVSGRPGPGSPPPPSAPPSDGPSVRLGGGAACSLGRGCRGWCCERES